jgi:hypothetical protein
MLSDLIPLILAAIDRHIARLDKLKLLKPAPGKPLDLTDLREQSAKICERDIDRAIEPEYQAIVVNEPEPDKKLQVLTAAHTSLAKLVRTELTRAKGKLDDGYYTAFIEGSMDALRSVYSNLADINPPATPAKLSKNLRALAKLIGS